MLNTCAAWYVYPYRAHQWAAVSVNGGVLCRLTGFFKSLGVKAVLDTNTGRDISLLEAAAEFLERYKAAHPGLKQHGEAVRQLPATLPHAYRCIFHVLGSSLRVLSCEAVILCQWKPLEASAAKTYCHEMAVKVQHHFT